MIAARPDTRAVARADAATGLCVETVLLGLICLADMLSTLFWVHQGVATEANPLLDVFLAHSTAAFVAVKLASFVPVLVLIEWYRRHNPRFTLGALRLSIALYLAGYVVLTARVNGL